ncbi:uncharacterized protein LOC122974803 isoform X2 [Thunnus albacares]|uniref:uncharacterized protein LOC122974803 isoform X2 n=1 Tax=Thunnus albacares TaxID=8236 RepID=UPI001CF6F4E9|nr:uncharacterized protein LOC122974803 isoform X2 [Thunnus albacares]
MSPPVQLQKTERPGWILLTPLSKSLVSPWTSTPTQSPLKRNQKKTHYSSSKDRLFDTEPLPKKAKRPQPQAPTPLPPPQVRGQCSTKQRDVITNITLLLQTVPASEATEVNHNSVHITQAVAQSDAPWLEAGQDRWPNRANYDALSMPRENSQHSSWPSEDQSSQSEAGHNNIMQTPQDSTRAESFLSLSDCRAPTAPNTICDFGQTVPVPWRDHRDNTQHRCTNTSSQALTVISSQQWAPFLPLSKMLRRHSSSPSDQEELCIPPRQGTDASDTTTSAPLSRLKERHGGQTALLKYCT